MKSKSTERGSDFSGAAQQTTGLRDGHGRPVRTLRLSVTDRCNHRCLYCMPEQGIRLLPRNSVMSIEEMMAITEILVSEGIRRVRITGGEPLVRSAVTELISRISEIPALETVAMTTNASLLAPVAAKLRTAGLQRLNISLDTMKAERFRVIARRETLEAVLSGLKAARQAGFENLHINTVAVRGFNDDELMNICRYAWDLGAVPRFIELMPTAATGYWSPRKMMTSAEVTATLEKAAGRKAIPTDARPGTGPARYLELGRGNLFGVISSVSGHICGNCDRIRLRATGELQTCLVRPTGPNLREALNAGGATEILRMVNQALLNKAERPEELAGPSSAMSSVGG